VNINNAIWLYSEKPLNSATFRHLPVYCTKAGKFIYERFILFDTYDLELNKYGIILFCKKTDINRLYLNKLSERHTALLPKKHKIPFTADILKESVLKKTVSDAINSRPLLAVQSVTLLVKTFSIVHGETGETVNVTEKRSSNSKNGCYYELTPPDSHITGLVAPALLEAGFSYITPAGYMRFFLNKNSVVKRFFTSFSIDSVSDLKITLKQLMNRAAAALELTFVHNDPKSVHDMRVFLRVMISLIFQKPLLYKTGYTAYYKKIFKKLRKLTSPIRDGDVFLKRLNHPSIKEYSRELREKLLHRRLELLEELKSYCENNDIHSVLTDENAFSDNTSAYADNLNLFVTARLRKILSSLKKLNEKTNGKLRGERGHKIRIIIKNLRYHLEFFPCSGFEEINSELTETLKDIQSVLGRLSDRCAQKKILNNLGAAKTDKRVLHEKLDKKEIKSAYNAIERLIRNCLCRIATLD
jgi:CHAD domain-containing protein